jgi:hypothetical protein
MIGQLSTLERARILHLLCEGTSIRAVCRLTGFSKNTVAKLLSDVGKVCVAYHDEAGKERHRPYSRRCNLSAAAPNHAND